MATNVYITGLSRAGFRVPDNTGALKRVKKGVNVQVNLDDDKTRKILFGEKDNFVRVSGSGSTTTTIIGLTRYGFRLKDNGGTTVTVKLGSGVHTIDLTNANSVRVLRRSFGRYLYVSSGDETIATVRGIAAQQAGFQVGDDTAAGTVTLTTSNAANATNGKTVQVGDTTYTIKTSLTEVQATGSINGSASANVADGETVTVNDITYRFKNTPAAANDIKIAGSGNTDTSLANLVKAINGTGVGDGTDYFAGTVKPTNVTAGAVTSHNVTLTAAVGTGTAPNSGGYPLSETSTNLTVTGFSGGVNPVANEVEIGGSADATLTNLSEAINKGTNGGVDYSSNTVANASATASAVASHAITLTAASDHEPDSITLATNETTYSFGNWAGGGVFKIYEGVSATVNPQKPAIYTQLRRHYKAYVEA